MHGNRLAAKVAIVTGSSSGLGRAIAIAFAAEGASLVICADLRPIIGGASFGAEEPAVPTHEFIQKQYGETSARFVRTDVTVGKDVENVVQEAVEWGGRLDMTVNSRSVFLGCKYACAQFLQQKLHPSGHRGWIINTASIMGLVGQKVHGGNVFVHHEPYDSPQAAYCASKGAVVQLTKQVAVEYAQYKIHCNALCPGHLRTPMTQEQYEDTTHRSAISAMTPWGDEWGSPQDVAKVAVFLASDDAAYVTGVPLPVDGGYCAQ
ncbi:MAG: hypothetical protein Q9203_003068 [Teloschistes exilis]